MYHLQQTALLSPSPPSVTFYPATYSVTATGASLRVLLSITSSSDISDLPLKRSTTFPCFDARLAAAIEIQKLSVRCWMTKSSIPEVLIPVDSC